MKIRMFYHSLVSDWNHGNAHFLRGVATELVLRGHDVLVYEPADGWSTANLIREHGIDPIRSFCRKYPKLRSVHYEEWNLNLDRALGDADLVIVHEWNSHELVRRIGECRSRHPFLLLFHDTHHRMVTDPSGMRAYDLSLYDGVLAYGRVLRDLYLERGLARRAWTWHEAADTRVFRPERGRGRRGDVVWIGNWGDGERGDELQEFLVRPVKELGIKARVYGVRYPDHALAALAEAGIEHGGWIPNHEVPEVFGQYKVTLHIPRRPYVTALPGIPTIRPFEALACGIPLVSSPWPDSEHLFRPGTDYLVARDGKDMKQKISMLLRREPLRYALAEEGLSTIHARHTVAHRVDELLALCRDFQNARRPATSGAARVGAYPMNL